ncbi:centrosomal protein of 152 kDa isoform X2 [Thalassophryne amazonica]|uniref:centrosomal protein of 152 kDa isoform X2 n=1 Tax=Thalassophryne amazonica TaxID=390379 RepID=UPI001471E055|nr:centrosomal protein of 152 kDa isoform X2 [Thalassophryne amazonica]
MSIDFDSAALQTQHDEEEYDQEDYAREQELHKLLTDLPDDMLEDSRDSSLEYSTCSNKHIGNSPQSTWTHQWTDHPGPSSCKENYNADYGTHEDQAVQVSGHGGHTRSHPLPHTWSQQAQGHQFNQYIGTERSAETSDFSTHDYESQQYPQSASNPEEYNGEVGRRDNQSCGDHDTRNHFMSTVADRGTAQYQAAYNPQRPACQPTMFNSQGAQQEAQFDHLQREFLDSAQHTADREKLAQLQILNKAQQRQIEDLERKLEDSKRNMRYLEHQFAIVKDEKDGLAVSLKESTRLIEEAKEKETQMQKKFKSMEQQIHVLNERDQENLKKQRVAEAAVDSMKQQMLDLCSSDTLSRLRQQHDRDLAVTKEQHEAEVLVLQQKLESSSETLKEQTDVGQRLREQLKQLEHQRQEEQLEKARVVNVLTQHLEESQQQCAKLLQTSSVHEMTQLQIKLQQAQSAKALSENMNKALQEDLLDLKEQINLYESAVKHGVIAFELSGDSENQLSDSCMDLGLKKSNWKNTMIHCTALTNLLDPQLPKEEALQQLRVEMQRCLASLKGKRQKISRLQEELHCCQNTVHELQTQLSEAQLSSSVRETSQNKCVDISGVSQKELMKLQEDKRQLEEKVEELENKIQLLEQSEEKVKTANLELCTKMREMIQELDQEKQETAQRFERIQQQYRDDVVNRVRTELTMEHKAEVEQLNTQHQQQIQQLQTHLSEVSDKMLAVQECYIAVCKEKDMIEESIRNRDKGETQEKMREENDKVVKTLRAELEAQHQASVEQLKALWSKEKETEIQQQVLSAQAAWKEEMKNMERTCTQRLEETKNSKCRETVEATCQTDELHISIMTVTVEELDSRLSAQKRHLQLEADSIRQKAVEEARKQTQQELHEKHLEDMARQVEGALTRAYSRWIEELTSLPEYQATVQTEKEKWEELQEKYIQQRVSQALKEAEEQWNKRDKEQLEDQSSGAQRVKMLQEEVVMLQNQLERVRKEQAALLKAELAGARAAWNRDKQQEISIIQARSEQLYNTKLQQQAKALEQDLQQAREKAELQKKETEAQLQQTLRVRQEEWSRQLTEKEQTQTKKIREDLVAELQIELAEIQSQLCRDSRKDQQRVEETSRISRASSVGSLAPIIQSFCKDIISRAVSQAKKEWKKVTEDRISRILKETQEQHQKEVEKIQNCISRKRDEDSCKTENAEAVAKLQKKVQELQRHLEKACCQLQNSVREHKAAIQRLNEEHERVLLKAKEEHLQQLEEVKKSKQSSGSPDHQQNLQLGLEEMTQQYLMTVEKIRGDMLRYLQDSRERAAEMIRVEVQRERQDTARKMRHYYLTCLQELLQDGENATGAEKKIMNAASKLVAMAKVLETPIKSKSGKNYSLPGCSTAVITSGCTPSRKADLSKNASTATADIRPGERNHKEKPDSGLNPGAAVRTKPVTQTGHQNSSTCDEGLANIQKLFSTSKPALHKEVLSHLQCHTVSISSKSRERYLQGGDTKVSENRPRSQPFLLTEAPIREERQADWSITSSDSETGFHVPRVSYSGRKVEPVKPFSVSGRESGEFGILTPNPPDMTIYDEIAKLSPHTQTLHFPVVKMSAHREPTPGSEAETQRAVCSAAFFELKQSQQDSGFESPVYRLKGQSEGEL